MNHHLFAINGDQTLHLRELRDALSEALSDELEKIAEFPIASLSITSCPECMTSCSNTCIGGCKYSCVGGCTITCGFSGCLQTCGPNCTGYCIWKTV